MPRISTITPEKFTTFGELLRYLRRKADLTQRELAIKVGYSESQISRLERDERAPEGATLAARFVTALFIEDQPQWTARLLELGAATHSQIPDIDQPPSIVEAKAAAPNNLPIQLTNFFGREKELKEIRNLLTSNPSEEGNVRLLTLSGHGGCGKTRLAIQAAFSLLDVFPDGIWLVEFAPLTEPDLVTSTLAAVLGIKEEADNDLMSAITDYLRGKTLLLIFDNCEHVVQAGAELAETLLQASSTLFILATSREMLGISGERAIYVPSLSMPDRRHPPLPGQLGRFESVQLFVDRAANVIPEFSLNENNETAVAQICQRLDGIPLAIELAAARLRMLPVEQIATRLDDVFRLLTGGSRTALPRHQTLQALMDWSYNLLTEPEKTMFRRLAVFAGGWTIEAAEVIGGAQGVETGNVFDTVAHLVDKSLVLVDEQDNVARYHFLGTVRQYASTKLAESGEADTIRRRHAEYYLALAEKDAHLVGYQRGPSWYDQIEIEHDNFRAVLTWCQSVADGVQIGFRLTDVLFPFYYYRGYWSEGLSWVEAILAHPRAGNYPLEQAQLQRMLGTALVVGGADYTAGISYMIRSLKVFQELNDRPNMAWSLHWLGLNARERGDALTARAHLEECVGIFQEIGDDSARAAATNTLAEAIILQGEGSLAKTILENNLVLARKVGEIDIIGWALNHLGHVAQLEGEFEQARQLHEESLPLFQRLGAHNQGTIWARQSLGETRLAQGQPSLAAAHFTKALESCHELGERAGKAWCLAGLAGVAALNEEPERAAWLWGAAEALRERIGTREAPASRATHERLKSEVRQQLGEDVFNAKWVEGQSASLEEAIAEASSWR